MPALRVSTTLLGFTYAL